MLTMCLPPFNIFGKNGLCQLEVKCEEELHD